MNNPIDTYSNPRKLKPTETLPSPTPSSESLETEQKISDTYKKSVQNQPVSESEFHPTPSSPLKLSASFNPPLESRSSTSIGSEKTTEIDEAAITHPPHSLDNDQQINIRPVLQKAYENYMSQKKGQSWQELHTVISNWEHKPVQEMAKKSIAWIFFRAIHWSSDEQKADFLKRNNNPQIREIREFADKLSGPALPSTSSSASSSSPSTIPTAKDEKSEVQETATKKRKKAVESLPIASSSSSSSDLPLPNKTELLRSIFDQLITLLPDRSKSQLIFKKNPEENFQKFMVKLNDFSSQELATASLISIDRFYWFVSHLDENKLVLLNESFNKLNRNQQTSLYNINRLASLVSSSQTRNANIILICYTKDIENDEPFVGLDNIKNNIDKFLSLYNFINESSAKDEGVIAVLGYIEEILKEWSHWNVQTEKDFLFFFEIVKTCHNQHISIFDILQKIKTNRIELYYHNLNDCLKETICLDYLIWKNFSVTDKEIDAFINQSAQKYTSQKVQPLIAPSVFKKHVSPTIPLATEQAQHRLSAHPHLTGGASVLVGDKEVFTQGLALALQTHSVLIEQFLRNEINIEPGHYRNYFFPQDHPFTAIAANYTYIYLNNTLSQERELPWQGVQFNITKDHRGNLRITHCSPLLRNPQNED